MHGNCESMPAERYRIRTRRGLEVGLQSSHSRLNVHREGIIDSRGNARGRESRLNPRPVCGLQNVVMNRIFGLSGQRREDTEFLVVAIRDGTSSCDAPREVCEMCQHEGCLHCIETRRCPHGSPNSPVEMAPQTSVHPESTHGLCEFGIIRENHSPIPCPRKGLGWVQTHG